MLTKTKKFNLTTTNKIARKTRGFTLIEVIITITVIAVLAGIATFAATSMQKNTRDSARDSQTQILANALEKYYRDNGEYPSVAAMTSSDVGALKKKLKVSDENLFKLPMASQANSFVVTSPSPTKVVYAANTTDIDKNDQCQNDPNGYCDGFTMQYIKEGTNTPETIQSLHATFEAVKDSSTCNEGDEQNGTTCTHRYAATQQVGSYSCPNGGTLSGSVCTSSYGASYSSGGGYYYCPSGATLSGSTCTTTSAATPFQDYDCGPGSAVIGANYPLCEHRYSPAYYPDYYSCPSGWTLNGATCYRTRPSYSATVTKHVKPAYETCTPKNPKKGQKVTCVQHPKEVTYTYSCPSGGSLSGKSCVFPYNGESQAATRRGGGAYCPQGGDLNGSTCLSTYDATPFTNYSCPYGQVRNGTSCVSTSNASYASYGGYYYCSGSDALSGSTCTRTQSATQAPSYYTCPNGGVPTGSTCSYTYELQG